jgi:diguanylate cyclase (GGDEF)-like protein/PAS domain S-box-containing protein
MRRARQLLEHRPQAFRPHRLTLWMVGLGVLTGAGLPPVVLLLGVSPAQALTVPFFCATLGAGLLVGGVNARLARVAVGRMAALGRLQAFQGLVDGAAVMIVVLDDDGTVHTQAGAVARLLGEGTPRLVGRRLLHLLHPDDVPGALAPLGGLFPPGRDEVVLEWRLRHAQGHWVQCESVIRDLRSDPVVRGLLVTTRDVAERKALEEQLRHRAFHDPLTGLPNRALFYDRVESALLRGDRAARGVGVLFLDLDDFKAVNDRLGHAAGDELLVGVARRLRASLRSADTAARLGGDEFGVLIEGIGGQGEAVQITQRTLAAFDVPFSLWGEPVRVRPSIGIAFTADPQAVSEELLRRADLAMFAAKRNGRGRYELFDERRAAPPLPGAPEPRAEEADRVTWFMRSDQQREEVLSVLADPALLTVAFQPIVDLRTGALAGYEALARFPGADGRPPNAWFAQAHRCGLGPQLEAAALRAALAVPGRPEGTFLAMNASPSALLSPELQSALPDELAGTIIEVTENELVHAGDTLPAVLALLRSRGALVAVDDAGSGYAGLRQLMRIGADIIKLDRLLVEGVRADPAKSALLEALVRYADRVGATICAEGVQDLADLPVLADLDVQFGQGFALGRPERAWPELTEEVRAACAGSLDALLRDARGFEVNVRQGLAEMARVSADLLAARSWGEIGGVMRSAAMTLNADQLAWHAVEGSELVVRAGARGPLPGQRSRPLPGGAVERALATGESVQILDDGTAAPGELAELEARRVAACLVVPGLVGGRAVGALQAWAPTARSWSRTEIHRARLLVALLAATQERLGEAGPGPAVHGSLAFS